MPFDLSKFKTSWDFSPLFKGDDDPKIELERINLRTQVNAFISKWKERDDYLQKPEVLQEVLNEYEKLPDRICESIRQNFEVQGVASVSQMEGVLT